MPLPKPTTVGELLYWSYANLAMMDAVLEDETTEPASKHFAIRSRLYAGLKSGTMDVRGYFDDEKLKLRLPKTCWYCGANLALSADHVMPQSKRGKDGGENLVYACRSCNSSKGGKDLLVWMAAKGRFPPLYLLRRYLKMAIDYCRKHDLMDISLAETGRISDSLPFALDQVPSNYPPAGELCRWVGEAAESDSDRNTHGE